MDDFLHNLRSGKLKQPDRQNRPYGDQQYKGGPRRNMMDRRKKEGDNKESFDRLHAIKEVLENLAATQKRMADAYQQRTRAEERKARAMEVLAKNLYRMVNPNADDADLLFDTPEPVAAHESAATSKPAGHNPPMPPQPETGAETAEPATAEPAEASATADEDANENESDKQSTGRLTELDRHTLYAVINQMRSEGNNWESIARHIAGQGYPTLSGKGVWRGVMVKNLYEKMATT